MENKRKTLKKLFRFFITLSFACFFALFISQHSGYAEYENRKQVALTEKQIKKFEKDISLGKKINMDSYLKKSHKNYQNKLSKIGLGLSNIAGAGVKKVVDKSFKFLSKLSE